MSDTITRLRAAHQEIGEILAQLTAAPKAPTHLPADRPWPGDPPWLKRAWADLGTLEIPGPRDHPRIVQMHGYTSLRATDDETPWCSSACCAWLEESGIRSTRDARARSWLDWGVPAEGARGDVAVFWRGSREGPQGHVGILLGPPAGGIIPVIGGNQRNQVCVARYALAQWLAYRRPGEAVK